MRTTKKAKAPLREQKGLSGAKTRGNCGEQYVKYR